MKTIHLHRFFEVEDGILGKLNMGTFTLTTLENDAKEIKAGSYPCKRDYYHRGDYATFEILVPGRTRILFHAGNIEDHSEGCVLLGMSLDVIQGKIGIVNSRDAHRKFMQALEGIDKFTLVVT